MPQVSWWGLQPHGSSVLITRMSVLQGTFEETTSMGAMINAIPEIGPWIAKLLNLDPSAHSAEILLGVRRSRRPRLRKMINVCL